MQKKSYDLIIFDCDGTLADSEPAHNHALSMTLNDMGLDHYTPELCMKTYMGSAFPAIMNLVHEKYGVIIPDDFIERNNALVSAKIPDVLRLDPTTESVLENLSQRDIRIAVGSNGQRVLVLEILQAAGFDKFFSEDRVFTFEDVEKPKPAPDLYLHVCDMMGVAPEKAVVLEDTVKGAIGGISAGIDTIGYTGLSHTENQDERLAIIGCTHVINKMDALLTLID